MGADATVGDGVGLRISSCAAAKWPSSRAAADIEIQAEEILHARKVLNDILSRHTGRPVEDVERDTDRDKFLSAEEARSYGLVDEVVESKKEPAPAGA